MVLLLLFVVATDPLPVFLLLFVVATDPLPGFVVAVCCCYGSTAWFCCFVVATDPLPAGQRSWNLHL